MSHRSQPSRVAFPVRSHRVRGLTAAALFAVAGLPGAASAAIFTFTGTCNNNWYGECITTPCGGGGWNTFNNWGQAGCAGGLATPGGADVAELGAASVTLNGDASVNGLTMDAAGVFTWSAGTLSIATPHSNVGTWVIPGNHKTLQLTTLLNDNTIILNGSFVLALDNSAIFNNGSFIVQGDKQLTVTAAGGAFLNSGDVVKTASGTADWYWPMTNEGDVDVQSGTMNYQTTAVTSHPATTTWTVGAAGVVRMNGSSMAGLFSGVNSGSFRLETGTTILSDTTFDISGNGLNWLSGNLGIAAGQTLVNIGRMEVPGNHKAQTGAFRNEGDVFMHGSFQWTLDNATVVNNDLMQILGDKQLYLGGGGGQFTNNAVMRKTDGGTGDVRWPVQNNGQMDVQSGTLLFQSTSVVSAPGSQWLTAAAGITRFASSSVSGVFSGANAGVFSIEGGVSIAANTTFDMSGNGVNWISGDMVFGPGVTVTNTGRMDIPGNHKGLVGGTFVNQNDLYMHGSFQVILSDSSVVNNDLLNIIGDKQLYVATGETGQFTNNATVLKDGGGTADFRWPMQNNALVDVQNGSLVMQSVPVVSGPASEWVNAVNGATRFVGCSLAGLFECDNLGTYQLETLTSIPVDTTFNVTSNGLSWANGNLVVAGGATLTNAGVLTVPGNHKSLTGAMVNDGTIASFGSFQFNLDSGTLESNGLFQISGDKQFYAVGAGNLFTSNGEVLKSGGGTADFRWPAVVNGDVNVLDGTLFMIDNSVTSDVGALWTTAAAGASRFSNCAFAGHFEGPSTGSFQIEAGATFPENTTFAIGGNGLNWANGNMSVASGKVLTNTGVMSVPGGHKALSGAMRNTGTIAAFGSFQMDLSTATLVNDGTLVASGDKQFYEGGGPNLFTNNGVLRKTDGGTGDFRWTTQNNGVVSIESGTLLLQNIFSQGFQGITRLAGGALTVYGPDQSFNGGFLEGSGTITGPVFNTGASVRPGGFSQTGALAVQGTYSQSNEGTYSVEIGGLTPGTQFDVLSTGGTATLAGTIAVRFINGFQPMAGDTFTVLTTPANGRQGLFNTIVVLDPLDGLVVAVDYTPQSVVVRVVQCTPCLPCDGDINCDGNLDGFDVQTMELAVGGDLADFCQADPDFNNDGNIDGFDVQAVELVVGGGFCP